METQKFNKENKENYNTPAIREVSYEKENLIVCMSTEETGEEQDP